MCDIIKILPVKLVLAKYRCPTELFREFWAELFSLRLVHCEERGQLVNHYLLELAMFEFRFVNLVVVVVVVLVVA